jgi:alkaline phosphatase D
MTELDRRAFLSLATAMGAAAAWASSEPIQAEGTPTTGSYRFPQGVASGDPDSNSVVLWTRRPFEGRVHARLRVEVAEDEAFSYLIATTSARIEEQSDWTCRTLVGNLRPATVYWYRFVDEEGFASRIGRTLTAPRDDDPTPTKFAFMCCQSINFGAQNAYRRLLFEDASSAQSDKVSFVVHLGDFIYQGIIYPEDKPDGFMGRRVRDSIRYPRGHKINGWNFPAELGDYRAAYRAVLGDVDIQDARANWPFICIWDNGEFSWEGWQSVQILTGEAGAAPAARPAQTLKVASNQAWFEYQPARVLTSLGATFDRFPAPHVKDAPLKRFDESGLGIEANNLAAIRSLTAYRALRWGRNVEIILTDQRSYCSEPPLANVGAFKLLDDSYFPWTTPSEILEILDAGRCYNNGNPPGEIRFDDKLIVNFRKSSPPRSILGTAQKNWFLNKLRSSNAVWKIWGNTVGTLENRVDPQNLPSTVGKPWPGESYGIMEGGDFSTAFSERAEIYGVVRDEGITGFAIISGNSHSFWAGLAAPSLPPGPFEPIGVAFVTSAVSSISPLEGLESGVLHDHPLRDLLIAPGVRTAAPEPIINLLLRHGVQSCLEYLRNRDIHAALSRSNPNLAPHLAFADLGANGFATVTASQEALECEFVCIPPPKERIGSPDGGPIRYRVAHRVALWKSGDAPKLERTRAEGDLRLST